MKVSEQKRLEKLSEKTLLLFVDKITALIKASQIKQLELDFIKED